MVREAKSTDPSGTINVSVWDSHMQQIESNQFCTITNCKLKQYYGKRLATTVNTTVTKAKEQDISHIERSQDKQNWMWCPEITSTDPSGTINVSVWDSHMQQIESNQFCTITNCKLKQYYGKRLATTVNTTVTKAKEQDISHIERSQDKQNWMWCPEITNVYLTDPVCNNKDCHKKISENRGQRLFVAYIATEQCC